MVKQNSVELYLTNLISLMRKSEAENAEGLMEYIMKQPTKLRTKHNYLNAIVSVAKHRPDLVKGDVLLVKKERDRLQSEINATVKESNVTDRQKEVMNRVKWQDVLDMIDEMKGDKDKSAKALEEYILVALMNPPLRNDLQEIIVSDDPKCVSSKKAENCIYIPKRKSVGARLIIKDHKTTSRGGEPIIRVLDSELSADVRKLVSDGRNYLFTDRSGKPFTSSSFTHRLNTLFQRKLGHKISSTLLRKIYLTDKYKDYKKVQTLMEEDAKQMGHSVATQQEHYVAET